MAVDQAKYMNFFPSNTMINNNNNNNNQFYDQSNNFIPNNESYHPLYNLNDVVYHPISGKMVTPAVKADSGITFNNSLIPPQPSRKRPRETISCVAPHMVTVNPMSNTTATTRSTSSINILDRGNNNTSSLSFLGQDLSLQIMQQQLDFDRLISHHTERMKIEIEERKKQQLRTIMGAMEESIGRRLREKEEELTKLGRINFALEEKVKSLCLENQIWRDLAQTNEATANTLRKNLEQVLQQMNDNVERNDVADDANSCCGSSGDAYDAVENGQSGWIYRGKSGGNGKNNNNDGNGRLCKKCGEGESSVLLLPCRHLCLCTTCGPSVNSCPICDTVKTASVHVNLS